MSDPSVFPGVAGISATASALTSGVTSKPGQLQRAAGEFESILLAQWLQGAEDSFGSVPGGDEDQDPGDQQMKSFAVQALAKAFTQAGGIGISAMVSKALDGSAAGRATEER